MARMTNLQFRMMDLLAHHEMNTTNGATPTEHSDVNTWLWPDEFAKDLGISEYQCGGVLTALQNAGFIGLDKAKKVRGQADESSVWFTKEGFTAWREARDVMEKEAAGEFPIAD